MQRHRRLLSSLIAFLCLAPALAGPVQATRPADPYVSRMTAVVGWITDPVTADAYYVMDATVHVQHARRQHSLGYRFLFSDGTGASECGLVLPAADASGESVLVLQLGIVPDQASSVYFASQVARQGRGGCAEGSPLARVTALLPERSAPPPAPSTWQVVFDVSFAAP
jgi:hypothetical protein